MNKWYQDIGSDGDVVISTRVRLARNISKYPFPVKMNDEQKQQVIEEVSDAVLKASDVQSETFQSIDMMTLSKAEAISLVECHLVSPEFISNRSGRALLLTKDESASIMINEEDHIRIQIIKSGLDFDTAYGEANLIDNLLDETLDIAFHEYLGYLTQCPTNLGTGMRASVMLHLPALEETGVLPRLLSGLSKVGLTMRGIYGEGSKAKGAIYQLSNQITLGISEECAIKNLSDITHQIIEQERTARKTLCKNIEMQDKIFRAFGILNYCKLLSNDEFMKYISYIKLGVESGLITETTSEKINQMIINSQPATMVKNAGEELTSSQRDEVRANLVKEYLNK